MHFRLINLSSQANSKLMMKNLPNFVTLLNLIFGCMAIVFILEEQILLHSVDGENYIPVMNMNKIYIGSGFIFLAALMDVLDGLLARLLNATSAIGKDLDSLADVVSFGVAPSMILYKYIQMAYMAEPGAMEVPILAFVPAFFLVACGAYRLARYNQNTKVGEDVIYFQGLPIPAVGIVIASIPLFTWFPSNFMLNAFPDDYNLSFIFGNRFVLYGISLILGLLMVSKISFFKWKPASMKLSDAWAHLILLISSIIAGIFLSFVAIPLLFVLYIVLNIIKSKKPQKITSKN